MLSESPAIMAVQQKILRRNRTSNRDISYKRWSLQFPGAYQWFEKQADFNSFSQFDRNDVLAYFPVQRARGAASLNDLSVSRPNPLVRRPTDSYTDSV